LTSFHPAACTQESELWTLDDYIKRKTNTKQVFKNEKQRKDYLVNKLGLKLQRDPKRNCWCVAVAKNTAMKTGLRLSATRTKSQNFENDKDASKEAFARAREGIEGSANVNTKDIRSGTWDGRVTGNEIGVQSIRI